MQGVAGMEGGSASPAQGRGRTEGQWEGGRQGRTAWLGDHVAVGLRRDDGTGRIWPEAAVKAQTQQLRVAP